MLFNRGIQVLTLWCILNALPGIGSLVYLALGKHAPGLRMLHTDTEIPLIEPRTLATVDGLAVIANTLIAVYCLTALMIVRKALARHDHWALPTLWFGHIGVQLAAIVSDFTYFGGKNVLPILVSSGLGFGGLVMCTIGRKNG